MNVGKSLKIALAKRGMSQKELARDLNLTRQWIGVIANKQTATRDTVHRLAAAVKMTPEEFLALAED